MFVEVFTMAPSTLFHDVVSCSICLPFDGIRFILTFNGFLLWFHFFCEGFYCFSGIKPVHCNVISSHSLENFTVESPRTTCKEIRARKRSCHWVTLGGREEGRRIHIIYISKPFLPFFFCFFFFGCFAVNTVNYVWEAQRWKERRLFIKLNPFYSF